MIFRYFLDYLDRNIYTTIWRYDTDNLWHVHYTNLSKKLFSYTIGDVVESIAPADPKQRKDVGYHLQKLFAGEDAVSFACGERSSLEEVQEAVKTDIEKAFVDFL